MHSISSDFSYHSKDPYQGKKCISVASVEPDDIQNSYHTTGGDLVLSQKVYSSFHPVFVLFCVSRYSRDSKQQTPNVNRWLGVGPNPHQTGLWTRTGSLWQGPGWLLPGYESGYQSTKRCVGFSRDVCLLSEMSDLPGYVLFWLKKKNGGSVDDVPSCYKEDLLKEIMLMKRIGQHSNIVLMLGACTLAEPIALIMEYMPFGNLQSFLR